MLGTVTTDRIDAARRDAHSALGVSADCPGVPSDAIVGATSDELAALTANELNVSIVDYRIALEQRDPVRWRVSRLTYCGAPHRAVDELHSRALVDCRG
jgi:hypothetical protein